MGGWSGRGVFAGGGGGDTGVDVNKEFKFFVKIQK